MAIVIVMVMITSGCHHLSDDRLRATYSATFTCTRRALLWLMPSRPCANSSFLLLSQPKTDEQRALHRHVGFVNFVSGRDAEKAKDALHGFSIDGAGDV